MSRFRRYLILVLGLFVGLMPLLGPAAGPGDSGRLAPGSPPPATYAQWLESQPPTAPLSARTVYRTPPPQSDDESEAAPNAAVRNYLIVIENYLHSYSDTQAAVATYISDVESEGFTVELVELDGGTGEGIRNLLISRYNTLPNFEGCFFIGHLAPLWFQTGWDEEFPCELYFMDLDGSWSDTTGDGTYDLHEAGSGDEGPEIYCGRVTAHKMHLEPGQNARSLTIRYLNKVHAYRQGRAITNGRACLYIDDPWRWWTDQYSTELAQAYPVMDIYDDPYKTIASDYLKKIQVRYAHLRVNVHFGAYGHGFGIPPEKHGGDVRPADLVANPPKVLTYHLYCCVAGRWTADDIIGLWYLFSGEGLGALASTKSGGMNNATEFYGPLGQDQSFGYSVMHWFDSFAPYDGEERDWTMGMLWLGDPTLCAPRASCGTLWHNTSSGEVAIWLLNDREMLSGGGTVTTVDPSSGWAIEGADDLDGNGGCDILWRDAITGEVAGWLMRGQTISRGKVIATVDPGSGWAIKGMGDFNGDGKADVLWRDATNGHVAVWLMRGLRLYGAGVAATVDPSSGWAIRGVADFTGDGKADILWRDSVSGAVAIWRMKGTKLVSGFVVTTVDPLSGWAIEGTGDFNGDGKPDILWHETTTGDVAVWLMKNTRLARAGVVASVDPLSSWAICGTGDFNSDGRDDVAWMDSSSGEFAVWQMKGLRLTGGAVVHTVDPASGWTVRGIGNFR